MRFFVILLIASLLQSSFLGLNLTLILLICRILLVSEGGDLVVAFLSGMSLSFLTSHNLGVYPIIFIFITKLTQLFKASPLSSNALTVFLFTSVILFFVAQIESLILGINFNLNKFLLEMVFIVPVYLIVYFWEERFVLPQKRSLILKKSLK